MEDAMVINKGSFQRGFCHASVYKTEIIDLCKVQGSAKDRTTLRFGMLSLVVLWFSLCSLYPHLMK